jgi:subtilisin family serine protease
MFKSVYRILKKKPDLAEKIDYGVAAVGAPAAWRETRGEGVTVMVLDTGITKGHPDLQPNIFLMLDFTQGRTPRKTAPDRDGHGTFTAGLVAALDNGRGVVGVAPRARLIAAKVLDDDGYGEDRWVTRAIRWAIRNKSRCGIEILSLSLGGPEVAPELKEAFVEARRAGLIAVCAAGNEGSRQAQAAGIDTVGYPARYAAEGLCIAVSAIDAHLDLADFSSTGPEVTFAAPGVEVTSTWLRRGYATLDGTSFSTPLISGVCALAIAKHRKLGGATPIQNLDDMVEHLKKISQDLGAVGRDNFFGYGLPVLGTGG